MNLWYARQKACMGTMHIWKELVLIYSVCFCFYFVFFASTSLIVSALYLFLFLTFLYASHDVSIDSWDVCIMEFLGCCLMRPCRYVHAFGCVVCASSSFAVCIIKEGVFSSRCKTIVRRLSTQTRAPAVHWEFIIITGDDFCTLPLHCNAWVT